MADSEQQVVLLSETNGDGEMVTVTQVSEVDTAGITGDILQQALQEASGGFDEQVYTTENVTVDSSVVADGSVVLTDGSQTEVPTEAYSYVTNVSDGIETDGIETVQSVQAITQQQIVEEDIVDSQEVDMTQVDHIINEDGNIIINTEDGEIAEAAMVDEGEEVTEVSQLNNQENGDYVAPLGSSGNPIRIVQQGNQYTSMQQLTPEQLSQIMQVVQQQQVKHTTTELGGAGSTVLFNPQTQTRIVYRVIYPSELHKKSDGDTSTTKTSSASTPRQIKVPKSMVTLGSDSQQKRTYRKKKIEEEERIEGPELTKEEKEERKKQRPKTRSGRVSRPPKHMVSDYKHIHPVDWDEDYDDSDGGYSDFRESDEEETSIKKLAEVEKKKESFKATSSQYNTIKPKNFKCRVCEKSYIGQAGLARHYRLNPRHGDGIPDDENINGIDTDESTQDSIASSAAPTGPTNVISPSGSSSIISPMGSPMKSGNVITIKPTVGQPKSTPTAAQARSVLKVKQQYATENSPARRKARLKELVKQCEDEELMEVVLPHLAKVITVWEFLLMKVEKGRPLKPHIQDVYKEFEQLQKQVQKMCKDYLTPLPGGTTTAGAGDAQNSPPDENTSIMHVTNASLATALGLSVGPYKVKEGPKLEDRFQYRLVPTEPMTAGETLSGKKRILEWDHTDETSKRQCKEEDVSDEASDEVLVTDTSTGKVALKVVTGGVNQTQTVIQNGHTGQQKNTIDTDTVGTIKSVTQGGIIDTGQTNIIRVSEGQQGSKLVEALNGNLGAINMEGSNLLLSVQSDTIEQEDNTEQAAEIKEISGEESEQTELLPEQSAIVEETEETESNSQVTQLVTTENGETLQIQGSIGELSQQHVTYRIAGQEEGTVLVAGGDQDVAAQLQGYVGQVVTDEGTGTQILLQQEGAVEQQVVEHANVFQTEEGLVLIQNPDGTFQVHGSTDQPIPLETVQALLAMDSEGQAQVETVEENT